MEIRLMKSTSSASWGFCDLNDFLIFVLRLWLACRHRPIPVKVEPPITITLSSDDEEEREYVKLDLVLPKQESSEENQEEH